MASTWIVYENDEAICFLEEVDSELVAINFPENRAFQINDKDKVMTIIFNGVELWIVEVVGKESGIIMKQKWQG